MRPPPYPSTSTSSPLHSSDSSTRPFAPLLSSPLHDRGRGDCQCSAAFVHHRMGRVRVRALALRSLCERVVASAAASLLSGERKSGEGRKNGRTNERTDEVEGTGKKREQAGDAKTHRQKDTGRQEILPLSAPHIVHLPSRRGDEDRFLYCKMSW